MRILSICDGEPIPDDDVLVTFHQITHENWPVRPGLDDRQQRVIDQLERLANGEQPLWLFDLDRYDRST